MHKPTNFKCLVVQAQKSPEAKFVWASFPVIPKHLKNTSILVSEQKANLSLAGRESQTNRISIWLWMHSLLPFGFSSVCSLVFPQLHRKCSFTFYLTDLHVIVVYGHANIIFQKNMVERVAEVGTPADDT